MVVDVVPDSAICRTNVSARLRLRCPPRRPHMGHQSPREGDEKGGRDLPGALGKVFGDGAEGYR